MTTPGPTTYRFTPRGEQALDALAAVLTHQMSDRTPEGIADVLGRVLHAPLEDLADALTAIAAQLPAEETAERDGEDPTAPSTTPKPCPDCQARPGEPCHVDCSSRWH